MAAAEPPEILDHLLQEAFALGCELNDPCWEALAGRGAARLLALRGDADQGWARVTDAHRRCLRHPDHYVWVEAWVLLGMIDIARRGRRDTAAASAVAALERLCARTEQPHMAARVNNEG
jgi:mannose/cellobiose epimerase-like protein (N-acyl-D-glucosamine 2-epimerase family)